MNTDLDLYVDYWDHFQCKLKKSSSPAPTQVSGNDTNGDSKAITVKLVSATPSVSPSKGLVDESAPSASREIPSLSTEVREGIETEQTGLNETVSTASSPSVITVFLPNAIVSPPPTQAAESRMVFPTPSMSPSLSASPTRYGAEFPQVSPSPCSSPSMTALKASLVSTMPIDNAMEPTVLDMPPVPTWALVSPKTSVNIEIGGKQNESTRNEEGVADHNEAGLETTSEAKKESSKEVSGGWFCFPGSAVVSLSDGRSIALSSVKVGDRVLIGDGTFSRVMAFTHTDASEESQFVRLHLTRGLSLRASAGHYVFIGRNSKLVAMRDVRVGDVMQTVTREGLSQLAIVHKVDAVWDQGLFNPQTESGDIVIDGVRASCYTEAVEPILGHSLLTFARALAISIPWATARIVSVGIENVALNVRHIAEPIFSKEL